MIYLVLAIICSSLIAIIFKFSEGKKANRYAVSVFNYIIAIFISYCLLSEKKVFDVTWFSSLKGEFLNVLSSGGMFSSNASAGFAVMLGAITGIIYFTGFWLYQVNVNKNGAALSVTFMKLGVLVPTILSIFFFKEIPTVFQILGIILAAAAIVIINLSSSGDILKSIKIELIILFILGGIGDFNSKIYENFGISNYKELFILSIFSSALIIAFLMLLAKDRNIKPVDIMVGFAVGIPNQLTSYFIIKALTAIKASVVFPVFSAGTILLVSIINMLFFKEQLSKKQYIAIGIIILALILLNL